MPFLQSLLFKTTILIFKGLYKIVFGIGFYLEIRFSSGFPTDTTILGHSVITKIFLHHKDELAGIFTFAIGSGSHQRNFLVPRHIGDDDAATYR